MKPPGVDRDEEIDVECIFISNTDLETMKLKLKEIGNLIWQVIKERIHNVLMRWCEAFAKAEVVLLKEKIGAVENENYKLQLKQEAQNVLPSKKKMVW